MKGGEEPIQVKKKPIAPPAGPADAEDFDATAEALERGQRARQIRTTRTALGLSQTEVCRAVPGAGRHAARLSRRASARPTSPWLI